MAAVALKDAPALSRDARRWLLGLVLVTACSWGRFLATGSPKVDENVPSAWAGTVLFVVLLAGWTLLVVGWRGMLSRPPTRQRALAFWGLLVAAFMVPMLSNDVFSLFAYGSLAREGHDVYSTASWLPHSVWYPWMGERWNDRVCVYGPTTLLSAMPAAFAGGNPWIALFALKTAWFIPLGLAMHLSFQRMGDRPFFHSMVWLNPLWIVEGPGQLHADLLGLAAITTGIALQSAAGRTRASTLFYGLATYCKYSFAMSGLWFWLSGTRTTKQQALRLPALAVVLLAVGVLLFAPFWRGSATVVEPIRTLASMNPGGSITEVAGIVVRFLRDGHLPRADLPVRAAVDFDRATNAGTWSVISLVLRALTVIIGARTLRDMLRQPPDERRIALGTGVIMIAVTTLASHRFQSWYLVAALPFFGLSSSDAWNKWWLLVVSVSVAVEFSNVLPATSPLFAAWVALSTFAVVATFVAFFRARFFAPLRDGAR